VAGFQRYLLRHACGGEWVTILRRFSDSWEVTSTLCAERFWTGTICYFSRGESEHHGLAFSVDSCSASSGWVVDLGLA
jgi:hypothetical protein